MNDTHPDIEKKLVEFMKGKTGEERLIMGCSLYDFSKQLVISSLRHQFPNASSSELWKRAFERFYGNDFDPETKEKIFRLSVQE